MAIAPTVLVTGDASAGLRFHTKLAQTPVTTLVWTDSPRPPVDIAVLAMDSPTRVTEAVRAASDGGLARHIVVVATTGSLEGLLSAVAAGADGWILPTAAAATIGRTLEGVHRGESGFSRMDAMQMLRASRSGPPLRTSADACLTSREREIHQLMVAGATSREIARRLVIAEGTVRWHAARAQKKMAATVRPGPQPFPSPARTDNHTIPRQRAASAPRISALPLDPPPELAVLSRAELRVALLVAEGMSNPEVATRLFVSRHTVESHLKQIFLKLEVRSRVQLTRSVLSATPAPTPTPTPSPSPQTS